MTAAVHDLTQVHAPTMRAIVQDRYGAPDVLRDPRTFRDATRVGDTVSSTMCLPVRVLKMKLSSSLPNGFRAARNSPCAS